VTSSPIASSQVANQSGHRAVVAPWHTTAVLLLLIGISFAGARSGNLPGVSTYGRAGGYLVVILLEWLTVAFIWYGVSRRGTRMADLVGGRWARPADILRDLGIGVAFLLVCGIGLMSALSHLLRVVENQAILQMLPRTRTEMILWCLMSLTAGFCEELIFRGYFQRQFTALTQSVIGGIVLQGIAFGAAHGYQGWKLMLSIAIFGTTFGLLAQWRRSLRPGMIAHFVQDAMGGLLARYLMH
jgi:membrane protease YdiL (CAAX protease family)